jgi:hypothetical protein
MQYPPRYNLTDPQNTPLVNAMAELWQLACRNDLVSRHATKPGSREAIEAIKAAIDFWAERETGHLEYFWDKPQRRRAWGD